MPKQRGETGRGAVRAGEGPPPLPDLSGVGLHLLRDLDEPVLRAAVDEVLRCPGQFTETWLGEDGGEGAPTKQPSEG